MSSEAKFQSRYGSGKLLTASQYLAELMCERQAKMKSKDLPDQFWRQPEWERVYALQARFAAALLKLYDVSTILRVLRTKQCAKTYSLGAKWLHPLLKAEAVIQKAKTTAPPAAVTPTVPSNEPPRDTFKAKPSMLNKLREAE